MSIKPQLAEDAILDKVQFPCLVQPKIDGVRAMNLNGTLTGRSLDPFEGFGITEYFSKPEFAGLDGEMILGDNPCAARLCSLTTGAMSKFKGATEMADLHWFVFDYVTPETMGLPYQDRFVLLKLRLNALQDPRIHLIPRSAFIGTRELLDEMMAQDSAAGFEGSIIRNPFAAYKEGRATKKNWELWRVKPWGDFEILVTGVTEGAENTNAAKKNTLGRTERSSAQDGMVPNGQIGSIQGRILKDVTDHLGNILFHAGMPITAGSGKMTVDEAKAWFEDQTQIVGWVAKIKHMTHGVKDLPRFPTFETRRLAQDVDRALLAK